MKASFSLFLSTNKFRISTLANLTLSSKAVKNKLEEYFDFTLTKFLMSSDIGNAVDLASIVMHGSSP